METGIYKDRNAKKDGWAVIAEYIEKFRDEAYKNFKSLRTYTKNEETKRLKLVVLEVKWFSFDAISFILIQNTANIGLDSETATANVII